MTPRARVMAVDDSALMRKLLAEVLSGDPEIEFIGATAHASVALTRVRSGNPDLVLLDVEMPGMNGLELLVEIRKIAPQLPVIMFSAFTKRAAVITLEALALGASDCVAKPAGAGDLEAWLNQVRQELLPRIKAFTGNPAGVSKSSNAAAKPAARLAKTPRRPQRVDIVAIGVSTGGPKALAEVVGALPATFPVPVVVVQHIHPVFTQLLADRLNSVGALKCREAQEGDLLSAGGLWLAPSGHHMTLRREGAKTYVALTKDAPENSCRPAVDVLFRSVGALYGANSLAVMLTGMGQDGLRGCELIHAAGGQIVAQDEATSVVWGMPGFVARAGLAHRILPLQDIAGELIRLTAQPGANAVQARN